MKRDRLNGSLLQSARDDRVDEARVLLEKGARVDARDENGCTCLSLAAHRGHAGTVKLFLDRGAKVDLPDESGITALMGAVGSGSVESGCGKFSGQKKRL
ncbi:ankyrin repeat domain-containing protein [Thermodesulfobacteriota bacterium]